MDIKNLAAGLNPSRPNEANKVADKPNTANSAGNQNIDANDKVTLTDNSAQVRDLEIKAQSVTVDNSQRIAELKAAIADGRYQVDANKVADKLMQSEVLFSKLSR